MTPTRPRGTRAAPPDLPRLEVSDGPAWREWLATHPESRGVWLVFWKKHTGRQSLTYEQAVEEALCFGWIDSILRRLDEDRYAQKFTPRTDPTKWSESNRARLRRLVAAGRMTDAGMATVCPEVLASLDSPAPPQRRAEVELDPELEVALRANARAREGFERLPPSARRLHVGWIMAAKRGDTRRRRLEEVISLLAQGKRLGLK